MTDYKIEEDAEGQLSYRGWPLKIISCGDQYLNSSPPMCHCGQPTYLAFPPYEGTLADWQKIWLSSPETLIPPYHHRPEYSNALGCRHVERGDSFMLPPTIQDVIDMFEAFVEQARKKTWEEVKGQI